MLTEQKSSNQKVQLIKSQEGSENEASPPTPAFPPGNRSMKLFRLSGDFALRRGLGTSNSPRCAWDCAIVRGLGRATEGTFAGMLPSLAQKILFLLNAVASPWPLEASV